MTEPRPRSFVWLKFNGQLFPQVWFEKPRVGCEGMTPVAEHKLEPSEYALTLDELVENYPAPTEKAS